MKKKEKEMKEEEKRGMKGCLKLEEGEKKQE